MSGDSNAMEEPAEDILRFIASRIDTVPEFEALLLFWEQRPSALTVKQLASMLYVSRDVGATVIRALERRRLIMPAAGSKYAYDSAWEPDGEFMARVAATYRRHLIRITRMIHSKAPTAVLEFARAFEPRKDT
jgi:hypothetical protein